MPYNGRVSHEATAMRSTVEKTIQAGRLPPELLNETTDPDDVVAVSVRVVQTVNGLSPEAEDEIIRAGESARRGDGLSPAFTSADDLIAHLHAESEKSE